MAYPRRVVSPRATLRYSPPRISGERNLTVQARPIAHRLVGGVRDHQSVGKSVRWRSMSRRGMLALEDGRVFRGRAWGAEGERLGELVFNTSLMGYQEILTDPSYAGQIVTMTYPLIGNYGVNPEDAESRRPFAEGLIVREYAEAPSNWRASGSLDDYLVRHGIVGLSEIDTRALVRHIREKGALRACLSSVDTDEARLVEKARHLAVGPQ